MRHSYVVRELFFVRSRDLSNKPFFILKENKLSQKLTQEEAIKRLTKARGHVMDFSNSVFKGVHHKILFRCKTCNEIKESGYKSILRGLKHGCEDCSRKGGGADWTKKIATQQIKNMEKLKGKFLDFSEAIYTGDLGRIKVICKLCGKIEYEKYSQLKVPTTLFHGCRDCSEKERKRLNKIQREKAMYEGLYEYAHLFDLETLTSPKSGYVTLKCKKCNKSKTIYYADILRNNHYQYGCGKCSREAMRISQEDYINACNERHNFLYDYSETVYSTSAEEIVVICKTHGRFNQRASSHKRGYGCPTCRNSRAERDIWNWLDRNQVEFIEQKAYDECRHINPLPFDFYLPKYNLLLEAQGKQHYEYVEFFFKTQEDFEKQLERDKIKKEFAKKNHRFLAIPYWDFDRIEEILEKELKTLDNNSKL